MTTENQLPVENQTTIAGNVESGGDFVAREWCWEMTRYHLTPNPHTA